MKASAAAGREKSGSVNQSVHLHPPLSTSRVRMTTAKQIQISRNLNCRLQTVKHVHLRRAIQSMHRSTNHAKLTTSKVSAWALELALSCSLNPMQQNREVMIVSLLLVLES